MERKLMATFAQLGTIATQAEYQQRVGYAMGVAAAAVYAESGGTAGHALRAAFATKVANGTYSLSSAAIMVLSNSTIAAEAVVTGSGNSIPDSDIQFSVNSLWNVMAGA